MGACGASRAAAGRPVWPLAGVGVYCGWFAAGRYGCAGGAGAGALQPAGLAVDGAGNVYVADADIHTLRRTSAGQARVDHPTGIAAD